MNPSKDAETAQIAPTAALILIGNEILSGRTQDKNLAFIGSRLAARGIVLREARVIADSPDVISATINTLRTQYTYVFTTGGIGPTHDDVTADCVAQAFGVELPVHAEAERRLLEYFRGRGVEPNADRMRMARIPQGAELVDNPVSIAPGFRMENVFVMAGVPRIMQAMFDNIEPTLAVGPSIGSVSVVCDLPEGDFAGDLRALQETLSELDLGSYPISVENGARVVLVARGTDVVKLTQASDQLQALVRRLGGTIYGDER